jgi:hypothetical protein
MSGPRTHNIFLGGPWHGRLVRHGAPMPMLRGTRVTVPLAPRTALPDTSLPHPRHCTLKLVTYERVLIRHSTPGGLSQLSAWVAEGHDLLVELVGCLSELHDLRVMTHQRMAWEA